MATARSRANSIAILGLVVALATIVPGVALAGPGLRSASALVVDHRNGEVVYAKDADTPRPIASLTKLMTALVVLGTDLPGDQVITIRRADRDVIKYSRSHLPVGARLTRDALLRAALVGSENRAAAALARTWPGGTAAFVPAMNARARELGMTASRFVEPTGLSPGNVASARDVVRLLDAAYQDPMLRQITTLARTEIPLLGHAEPMTYPNTNLLVRRPRDEWPIGLSKTGYIQEAGRCLAMQAEVAGRPLFIVLLNSWGKLTPIGDSNRLRQWLERAATAQVPDTPGGAG